MSRLHDQRPGQLQRKSSHIPRVSLHGMVFRRLSSLIMGLSMHQKRMPHLPRTSYQFYHIMSSPYFAQSKGEAERAVGNIKNLLKKSDDPYLALLVYRATPLQNGYSPSELLTCHMLRTTVPSTRSQRSPRIPDAVTLRAKDEHLKSRQKQNFDSHHGARELPPLAPGDTVLGLRS